MHDHDIQWGYEAYDGKRNKVSVFLVSNETHIVFKDMDLSLLRKICVNQVALRF